MARPKPYEFTSGELYRIKAQISKAINCISKKECLDKYDIQAIEKLLCLMSYFNDKMEQCVLQ